MVVTLLSIVYHFHFGVQLLVFGKILPCESSANQKTDKNHIYLFLNLYKQLSITWIGGERSFGFLHVLPKVKIISMGNKQLFAVLWRGKSVQQWIDGRVQRENEHDQPGVQIGCKC